MRRDSQALFLTLFIAMVVAGAGLILSLPSLFGPHEPYQVWRAGVLGVLGVIFAVGTLYLRPTHQRPSEGNTDE